MNVIRHISKNSDSDLKDAMYNIKLNKSLQDYEYLTIFLKRPYAYKIYPVNGYAYIIYKDL